MEKIYELELGGSCDVNDSRYYRVPGGWIVVVSYMIYGGEKVKQNPVFVPYNNEFYKIE